MVLCFSNTSKLVIMVSVRERDTERERARERERGERARQREKRCCVVGAISTCASSDAIAGDSATTLGSSALVRHRMLLCP